MKMERHLHNLLKLQYTWVILRFIGDIDTKLAISTHLFWCDVVYFGRFVYRLEPLVYVKNADIYTEKHFRSTIFTTFSKLLVKYYKKKKLSKDVVV